MRRVFFKELYKLMKKDKNVWAVTSDLGDGGFNKIMADFPDRFVNTGASEQAGVGISVGLALEGKTVFYYTIGSFYLRAAETIALYLHNEQIPVILISSGRGKDYAEDGPSHDCTLAEKYIDSLDIATFYPDSKKKIDNLLKVVVESKRPTFISLRR